MGILVATHNAKKKIVTLHESFATLELLPWHLLIYNNRISDINDAPLHQIQYNTQNIYFILSYSVISS